MIASYKHTTTPDVTTGIELAVRKVLEKGGLTERLGEILSVTIGTTVSALDYGLWVSMCV